MKKLRLIPIVFLLMISLTACSGGKIKPDSVYDKIHSLYYDIQSYKTSCKVTVYTPGGENTYNCDITYNKDEDNYEVVSEDMKIFLTKDKTIISKDGNTLESPSMPEDMYIFINTFFKSYYESEDTVLSVNLPEKSNLVLLECSTVNPTEYISSMKLWLHGESAKPVRMQVLGNDNKVSTEIEFLDFSFTGL